MEALHFVATVVLITASGALAPGPLFFATVSHGVRSGVKSGLVFSIAHSLVEFTLVILLALGLLSISEIPFVKFATGLTGGIVLLVFGVMQIVESLKPVTSETKKEEKALKRLLIIGLAFTALNPFFIVWWLTVGANLILISLEFGSLAGVVFMYVCHVWMDFAWLTSVSYFSKIGIDVVGLKWYKAVMAIFGAVLVYFGYTFIIGVM